MRRVCVLLTAAMASAPAAILADDAPAKPTPAAAPCSAAERHQFDFWIGDWNVTTPDGKPAGTNRIDSVLKGCAVHENWLGARGGHGESLNAYSPADGRWHQTWIDDSGGVLFLTGGFENGKMILESAAQPSKKSPGKKVRNRITWSKLDAGRVRQLWESTDDDGKSWSVQFDGTYAKKP